jgi:hypothetical protein
MLVSAVELAMGITVTHVALRKPAERRDCWNGTGLVRRRSARFG